MLANVDGVMNAVMVKGDAVGPTLYYGAGAGAEPTASAVVADMIDVVREFNLEPENRVPYLAFHTEALSQEPVLPMRDVETAYYLRLSARDEPGVLADVTRVLGDFGISIEAIIQKQPQAGADHVPIILLTHRIHERHMDAAIERLEHLEQVDGRVVRIRVESLE